MRKIVLAILFVLTGMMAQAKQHKSKKTKSGLEIVSISSYHTGCFGRCPSFQVEVDKYGIATYTGIRFVHDSGVFKKSIGKAKAARIINGFKNFHADTCRNRYESRAVDLPGINLTINYTGKTKTIQNSNFGPAGLMKIASAIDSVAMGGLDETWHKVDDGNGK